MTRDVLLLLLGLSIGGLVGVWMGGAGRVWTMVFLQWVDEGRRG